MKIGDKVVCVDNSPCKQCGKPISLIYGNVYVIANIFKPFNSIGIQTIGMNEANHPNCSHWLDRQIFGYSSNRFRKLDDMKREAALRQQQEQPV